jgi:hypothetical protein
MNRSRGVNKSRLMTELHEFGCENNFLVAQHLEVWFSGVVIKADHSNRVKERRESALAQERRDVAFFDQRTPPALPFLFFAFSHARLWNCVKKAFSRFNLCMALAQSGVSARLESVQGACVTRANLFALRSLSLAQIRERPFDPQVKLQRRPLAKYVWERKLKRPTHLRSTALRVRMRTHAEFAAD